MDMYFKQLFAPIVGLNMADVVSVAKTRFAQWYSEFSYFTSCIGGIMKKAKPEQSNHCCQFSP